MLLEFIWHIEAYKQKLDIRQRVTTKKYKSIIIKQIIQSLNHTS